MGHRQSHDLAAEVGAIRTTVDKLLEWRGTTLLQLDCEIKSLFCSPQIVAWNVKQIHAVDEELLLLVPRLDALQKELRGRQDIKAKQALLILSRIISATTIILRPRAINMGLK